MILVGGPVNSTQMLIFIYIYNIITYIYTYIWGKQHNYPKIYSRPHHEVPDMENIVPADVFPDVFVDADLWKDARMPEVIRYLYGGIGTQLPPCWHHLIPRKMWGKWCLFVGIKFVFFWMVQGSLRASINFVLKLNDSPKNRTLWLKSGTVAVYLSTSGV